MLRNVNWSEDRTYRTESKNKPLHFYLNGLCNSTRLDLLLGYFSSSAIHLLSLGFAKFLYSEGMVRMVINNVLSKRDKELITVAKEANYSDDAIDLRDLKRLSKTLDVYDKHFFECLAWLIRNNKIQIQIVKPIEGNGIAHYKSGIFSDGTDQVYFTASCNFTSYGLSQNLEQLSCFLSWEEVIIKRLENQQEQFETIFSGKADFVEYLDVSQVQAAIVDTFGDKTLRELLIQEKELIEKKKELLEDREIKSLYEELAKQIEIIENSPHFPYPEGARPYQLDAYNNWVTNDYKGIFAMATGTGKTITSLNCIVEEFKRDNYYRFIVLVPTIALAGQWEKEISDKFNFKEVTICSTLNSDWESSLRRYGRNLRLSKDFSFSIVITYASFRGKKFQRIFKDLFQNYMESITLIADEAHTLGSEKLLSVLPFEIKKRVGLSATPERQYDEKGGFEICNFFQSFAPSYTFSYNMKKAIEDEVLCKYFYYPKIVELEEDELVAYRSISAKLVKFLDPDTGRYKEDPYVTNLLIQRKNIIHKAKNKADCLLEIIDQIGKDNFRFAFIYTPEGFEPNYLEDDIDVTDDNDDTIIKKYTELLYNKYHFKLRKFTGETSDRENVLRQFGQGKLDALLAMKCLDEGVDIPQTKFAIFCSSTGNSRQYIQRRGRVLRSHESKQYAVIYDMIVKPSMESTILDLKQIKTERGILINEVRRLVNFAVLSENKNECLRELEELCYSMNIDIYDMSNKEEEKYNLN